MMNDILRNNDAPCKQWRTVRDAVIRETGLKRSIQDYATCPSHVCFAEQHQEEMKAECPICHGSRPVFIRATNSVSYMPLLPRISLFVQNEKTCLQLYSYLNGLEFEQGI